MIKSELLRYEDFKKEVMEKFQKYFPEERQLVYSQVRKNNAVKDSVALRIDGIEGINATTVIYIQDMYNCYLHDEIDMHKFLEKMASILMEDDEYISVTQDEMESWTVWDNVKDNIYCVLINAERNKDKLSNIPHRNFLDLAITYKVELSICGGHNKASMDIDNIYLQKINKTEEDIYFEAKKNTPRILQVNSFELDDGVKCLINHEKFASTIIMYEEALQELASQMKDDLVIIPDSVHSCMVISKNWLSDIDELKEVKKLIQIINQDSNLIEPEHVLSDNIYYFDSKKGELRVIAD